MNVSGQRVFLGSFYRGGSFPRKHYFHPPSRLGAEHVSVLDGGGSYYSHYFRPAIERDLQHCDRQLPDEGVHDHHAYAAAVRRHMMMV